MGSAVDRGNDSSILLRAKLFYTPLRARIVVRPPSLCVFPSLQRGFPMIDELRLKTDVPLTPNQQYDYVALARCRIPSFQPMQRTAILTYCAEDYSGLDHLYAIDNAQAFVDEALDDPWFRRRFPNVQPITVYFTRKRTSWARIGSQEIVLTKNLKDARNRLLPSFYVLLHELAHHCSGRYGHNARFRQCLLLLIGRYWNVDARIRLSRSFRLYGLPCAP